MAGSTGASQVIVPGGSPPSCAADINQLKDSPRTNGTKPGDINAAIRRTVPGAPPTFPQLIDDDNNRVFRGIAAFPPVNVDRVERGDELPAFPSKDCQWIEWRTHSFLDA